MTEYDLFVTVVGLADSLWPDVFPAALAPEVLQTPQDQAEGVSTGPALYLDLIGPARRYGWTQKSDAPDPDNLVGMIHTERQLYEATFQATALWQNDGNATALDVAVNAATLLQHDLGLDYLRERGVGVLRIGDIRTPHFVNGSDENQMAPSFDFVLTYEQVTITKSPAATATVFRQHPV